MTTYADTYYRAATHNVTPAACKGCHLTATTGLSWHIGTDTGWDAQYVGYQCANCGQIQGLTRATILRKLKRMA